MTNLFPKFQNTIFFHNSEEDLHKHVNSKILPQEFGGAMGPFSNKDIHAAVMKFEKYFEEVKDMADKYNAKHS